MFPNRLMTCVDGPSTLATAQVELAWLARHFAAEMVVFHASGPWSGSSSGLTEELIEEVANGPLFDGISVRVVNDPSEKDIVACILEQADHVDADLLVLPVHRRSGVQRMLKRDAAEALVRSCRIPILTLDSERCPDVIEAPAFDTVIAPVDFSPPSRGALTVAGNLARGLDAPMVLVHALPDLPFTLSKEITEAELNDWMTRAAIEKIEEDAKKCIPDGVRWAPIAPTASVLDAVKDAAAAADNPLVVMSTAGRDSLGDQVLGSRTERIFRSGAGSVLIIPAEMTGRLAKQTTAIEPA